METSATNDKTTGQAAKSHPDPGSSEGDHACLRVRVEHSEVLNYASVVNKLPVIGRLDIKNNSGSTLRDLVVNIQTEPALIKPHVIHVSEIRPDEHWVTETVLLQPDHAALSDLNESRPLAMKVYITDNGVLLAQQEFSVEAAAYEQWPGDRLLPQLLSAFSQPNTKATASIQKKAAQLLRQKGKTLSGYQAETAADVALQVSAVYSAVAALDLDYANPPAGLVEKGQLIRTPARIIQDRLATCLDTVMLMASVLESVGLHPVLLLARDHAWLGVWLTDESFNEVCTSDAQVVRKRMTSGKLVAIETTLLCGDDRASCRDAMKKGEERLDPERHDDFCYAVDVIRARHQKISPLPAPGQAAEDQSVDAEDPGIVLDDDLPITPLVDEEMERQAEANATQTSARIEQWKNQLLDFSMRNRLLNCDPGKHSLRLLHPEPAAVEDALADGTKLIIESINQHAVGNDPRNERLLSNRADRSYQDELALQAFSRKRLLCLHDTDRTQKLLTKIFRDATSNEDETGSNTLYLCLGALNWRPGGRTQDYMAPLLMLPMRLSRRSVGGEFKLTRHDDDPVLNPTLLQVLRDQFAIQVPGIVSPHALPTDESGVDVSRILGLIAAAVADQPHMEVRSDIIQLGNYSFAKHLLWMDLAHKTELLLKHPLIELMVEGTSSAAEKLGSGEVIERNELDEKIDVGELKIVTKADASQMVVIHGASVGRSFVCEGPPGTGKSETITNIIADQLGRGRRVLFVSEKMEALDVVHSRLCDVGLEPFLMVLHAARASKKEVVDQYRKAVEAADTYQVEGWEALCDQLRVRRDRLNAYVQMLHAPHPAGLTVHKAIATLTAHPDWQPAPLSWASLESVDKEYRERLAEAARNMSVLAADTGGLANQALEGIHMTRFTPSARDELLGRADRFAAAYDAMHPMFLDLARELEIPGLQWTPADYDRIGAMLLALTDPPAIPEPISTAESADQVRNDLSQIIELIHRRRDQGMVVFDTLIEDSVKLDVDDLKLRWRAASGRVWPMSWFARLGIRNHLKLYKINGKRPRSAGVLDLTDMIAGVQQTDAAIAAAKDRAAGLLGDAYRGLDTDIEALERVQAWMDTLDTALKALIPATADRWLYHRCLIAMAAHRTEELASTGTLGRRYHDGLALKAKLDQTLHDVCETAARTVGEAVPPDMQNALQKWADQTRRWKGAASKLQAWCVWRAERDKAVAVGLAPMVASLEVADLDPSEFEAFFEFSFAHWWLNQMVERTPLLQQFSRSLHEQDIADFRTIDAQFMQATRDMIFAKLASNVPRPDVNIPGSPMGFLRDQMTRQRGHKSIREIMQRLGEQNQRLKPCMMMSPLTVAQYLEVAETGFDVVVFDEASQIKTCEAIGVIARAPQVIVVGDSKQLPPTSFFAAGSQEGDGEYQDHESILDECAAVLPSYRLCWHYRSRNEQLIAFSNDRYYDGELISMPAPTQERAVTLHRVDGIYDRGKSRTNRIEADAVIAFIKERVLAPGTRRQSMGVVTLSAAQQSLVLNFLEDAAAKEPLLEQAIKGQFNDESKPLFVKNLESVQGDQRDVVVFSIAYGRTANGVVYNEFGPINRPGGQRRLNVAVTRAADEVHVFSSMDPEDIKSAYLQASESGVGDLKRYLLFARDGVSALESYSTPTGRGADSDFEVQVMRRLIDKGWDVHPQIGVSKFRIDMAVVNPRHPGRYLAGVECDGATYHSSATARDRDIVRQEVLERLGWRILRIWSTDWWLDAGSETDRIHAALLALHEEPAITTDEADTDFDPGSVVAETGANDATGESHTGEEQSPPASGKCQHEAGKSPAAENSETEAQMELRARSPAERVHREYPHYAPPSVPTAKGSLYDARAGSFTHRIAQGILEQAAPMRRESLYRSVLQAYGQTRLTQKATETLDRHLGALALTGVHGEDLFWHTHQQAAGYRGFRVGSARHINEVPLLELANLANDLLENAMQCPKNDLCRTIAHWYDVKRLGTDVETRLLAALDVLIEQGQAESCADNQIRHVPADMGPPSR